MTEADVGRLLSNDPPPSKAWTFFAIQSGNEACDLVG